MWTEIISYIYVSPFKKKKFSESSPTTQEDDITE